MPMYDYKCAKCGITTELHHGWYDRPIVPCTYCNEPMTKVIAATPSHFKGTGWGKD